MMPTIGEYDYINDLGVYYELRIHSLTRERMKITRRGRLTAAEDRRLDEIDSEIDYWWDRLDIITDDSDDETNI